MYTRFLLKNRTTLLTEKLIVTIFACAYLILFLTISKLTLISSIFFYASFILIFLVWLLNLSSGIQKVDRLAIAIIIISFFCISVNAILCDAVISFNYMKKYIMFCSTILWFSVMSNANVISMKSIRRAIHLMNFLFSFFLIIVFILSNDQLFFWNGIKTKYLLFNFENPNKTGMYLAVVSIYNLLGTTFWKKYFIKIISLLEFFALFYFIYLTKCRTALLAVLFFVTVFLYFICFQKGKTFKIKKFVSVCLALFPLIFAILYLNIIQTSWIRQHFSFLVEEGKNLDSRSDMWLFAFEKYKESPFFGAYYQISGGSGQSQLHNIEVDILVSYGPVVLILLIIWLSQIMLLWNKRKNQPLYCIALITALLLGCGEAALFSGAAGYNILVGGFIALSFQTNGYNLHRKFDDENVRFKEYLELYKEAGN